MDFDDLDAPRKVPAARVSKFAPKSSKLKPKPKSEPVPKPEPEPQPSPLHSTKPEPHEFDLTAKKNEDRMETTATTHEKPEPTDDAVIMNDESMPDAEEAYSIKDVAMEEVQVEEEEEDSIVHEIDISFTPSLNPDTQLLVFQYPLRASWRPYELDEKCKEVRFKPKSLNTEMDMAVDLDSRNVDRDFAMKLNYSHQTLSTQWKPHDAKGCAVGLLKGDKLHLHPIRAVLQFRPLQHRNLGGSKNMNTSSAGANATVKNAGSIEEKPVPRSKKQYSQMEPSVEEESDAEECCISLKYHGCESEISSRYLQQMVARESSLINFTMSTHDYITTLCPGGSSNISSKGLSKSHLLSLPVEERLKKTLLEGSPIKRFCALKYFAPEISDEELLEFLQQHAVLLWGHWAPKSALVCQNGMESLGRDYVILLFSKNLKVMFSDLSVRLDSELGKLVKNFLNTFGVEKTEISKGNSHSETYWKFREQPDDSFKKCHRKVVEKQAEIFKMIEPKIFGAVGAGKRKVSKNAVANSGVKREPVKSENSNPRLTDMGGVPPRRMAMSTETQHALPIALKKLFQTHKVCSFQMICQGLREMAVSKKLLLKGDSKIVEDAARSLDGPQDELKAVISEVACDIHGYYVLKSSQDDPFRDVVIDMLRGGGPNAMLKRSEIQEAARTKLSREFTSSEYTKVMNELCVTKGSHWVLKSGDGSMQ